MTPAVAIVVPTYNRADSLELLLRALDGQEPVDGDHEVVVVDDGSSDHTADVIAGHAAVRYLLQANSGPAAARNLGWRSTSAPVVAFTDDDTIPDRTWLRELVDALADDEVAAVGGRITGQRRSFVSDFVQFERLVDHGIDPDGTARFLVTANMAIRRAALESVGGFSEELRAGEDVDLSIRLRSSGATLRALSNAAVRHAHPVSWREVVRRYVAEGRALTVLLRVHPELGGYAGARRLLTVRHWRRMFRDCQRKVGASAPRAIAYCLMSLIGMALRLLGALLAGREDRAAHDRHRR